MLKIYTHEYDSICRKHLVIMTMMYFCIYYKWYRLYKLSSIWRTVKKFKILSGKMINDTHNVHSKIVQLIIYTNSECIIYSYIVY